VRLCSWFAADFSYSIAGQRICLKLFFCQFSMLRFVESADDVDDIIKIDDTSEVKKD